MTTLAAEAGDSPEHQPSYWPYLLLHHILKLLETEGCKGVTVISDNVGSAVKAAKALLLALNVEPDMGES